VVAASATIELSVRLKVTVVSTMSGLAHVSVAALHVDLAGARVYALEDVADDGLAGLAVLGGRTGESADIPVLVWRRVG